MSPTPCILHCSYRLPWHRYPPNNSSAIVCVGSKFVRCLIRWFQVQLGLLFAYLFARCLARHITSLPQLSGFLIGIQTLHLNNLDWWKHVVSEIAIWPSFLNQSTYARHGLHLRRCEWIIAHIEAKRTMGSRGSRGSRGRGKARVGFRRSERCDLAYRRNEKKPAGGRGQNQR